MKEPNVKQKRVKLDLKLCSVEMHRTGKVVGIKCCGLAAARRGDVFHEHVARGKKFYVASRVVPKIEENGIYIEGTETIRVAHRVFDDCRKADRWMREAQKALESWDAAQKTTEA